MLHRGGDVEGRESEIRRCPDLKGERERDTTQSTTFYHGMRPN